MFNSKLRRGTVNFFVLCVLILSTAITWPGLCLQRQRKREVLSPGIALDSYFNYSEKCMGRGSFGHGSFEDSTFQCSSNFEVNLVAYESSLEQLRIALQHYLNCVCNGNENEAIAFTIADKSYRNGLGNYAESVKRFSGIPFFVIALDHQIIPFLKDRHIPYFAWIRGLHDNVGNSKVFVALEILRMGKRVLFSEMDVYWSKNPIEHFYQEYDLEISQHSYHPEINFGFFTAQPTPAAMALFEEYQRYALAHPGYSLQLTLDQKLFDAILRGPENETVQHRFTDIEKKLVNWRYLPLEQFYHNPSEFAYEENPNRVVSHLSWGLGAPERRMLRAKQLNLWRDPWYFSGSSFVSFRGGTLSENLPMLAIFALHVSRKILIPPQTIDSLYNLDIQHFACNFDYVLGTHFNITGVEVDLYQTDGPSSCEHVNGVYKLSANTKLSVAANRCGDVFMRSPVWILRHVNFDYQFFITNEKYSRLSFSFADSFK